MDELDAKGIDEADVKGIDEADAKGMDELDAKGIDEADAKGNDEAAVEGNDEADENGRDEDGITDTPDDKDGENDPNTLSHTEEAEDDIPFSLDSRNTDTDTPPTPDPFELSACGNDVFSIITVDNSIPTNPLSPLDGTPIH